MYILMVRMAVKPDQVQDFIAASILDASGSVNNEPGCRRFDIIQDAEIPTKFAFTEVYNDEAAFEAHKVAPHFKTWDAAVKDLFASDLAVSFCRPVFPRGDARWDATNPNADPDAYFGGSSLHVIHAAKYIKPKHVDAFIEAVSLDGLGSTHQEPGCLRFDVYQNINDPTELHLYEVYANPPAFDYHRGTPHIRKWQETVQDLYGPEHPGRVVGRNIWPPDNWNWSSGCPTV